MEIKKIEHKNIFPDKNQPRKDFEEKTLERLKQSIKENGIELPIIVRKVGKKYIIIDGERRWRASKELLLEMPCIVKNLHDNGEILEHQLRTDCLKEELSVTELDNAIYEYYKYFYEQMNKKDRTSSEKISNKIAYKIGKSSKRVMIAIDRHNFKKENIDFIKTIEKKHNPDNKPFGKVNSTIAMTKPIKDREVRKAAVEEILKSRSSKRPELNNKKIKEKVKQLIEKKIEDPSDVKAVFRNMEENKIEDDPRYVFFEFHYEFNTLFKKFKKYEFIKIKEYLQGERLKTFIKEVDEFKNLLKKLEIKNE